MSHLAIIDTWDEIYHGYGSNESIKYISTLKNLLFVYEIYTPYNTVGDFTLNSRAEWNHPSIPRTSQNASMYSSSCSSSP